MKPPRNRKTLCIFKLPLLSGLFATLCVVICESGLTQDKTDVPASSVAAESVTDAQIVAAQKRADELIAQMSLDEKLQMVHGTGVPGYGEKKGYVAGYCGRVAGIPRLGIPELRLADGPEGVANGSMDVTAFQSPLGMAASWDVALIRRMGEVIGNEHAGKGHNVVLAPMLNILRVPQFGRAFETFSEDPLLTAKIADAEIIGIQSQGVMATAKHLAANNQEHDRAFTDAVVGERALQEIYLPAFESTVKDAGVVAVMGAYNKVNGTYACENPSLMSGILKGEWGFPGFVMSDWAATHDAEKSANAGLDMEMPFGPTPDYPVVFGEPLKTAIDSGRVPMARLDDMVRRVLVAMIRVGLLDHPLTGGQDKPVSTAEHRELSRQTSAQGIVLLKNDRNILPLDTKKKLAVIGAAADKGAVYTGVGSAKVIPSHTVTPLQGIQARVGDSMRVTYATGTEGIAALPDLPEDALTTEDGSSKGLTATYFTSPDFSGTPVMTRVESQIGFDRTPLEQLSGVWSARWTGKLTPTVTGLHRFSLNSYGIAKVFINDRLVLDAYGRDRSPIIHGLVDLTAGTPATIRIEYVAQVIPRRIPTLQVGWTQPKGLLEQAVDAAKSADAAVVFVNDQRVEGGDQATLSLPGDQDRLIEAVAKANPATVVVLNTGGPVLMPWLDNVAGVIEAWYPGQESGSAIASVLFGDVNPSGRLPITFPRSDEQTPVSDPQRWPGKNQIARYDEALEVGYRWYDAHGETPLFPFGFGLSYTKFDYGELKVSHRKSNGDDTVDLAVDVTNSGTKAGAEVVQLYLGDPPAAGEPPRQLKAFQKIDLRPNERATVTFTLGKRDLSTWDESQHRWVTPSGTYQIMVGSSSRDIRAQQSVSLD
jgi:beta-glucosidase